MSAASLAGVPQAGATTDEVVLSLSGIRKTYGATRALRGVDLTLRRGEFVGLLGPNGAGKSTLIKILDGVETADEGRIQADRGLGVVHQDLGLVETMTVTENLFLGRAGGSWIRPRRELAEASQALGQVGLEHVDPSALVESLSLGERTMVAVARLLKQGAEVVVVDEVTAGLAPAEAEWLVRKLRDAAHLGATVLMVTHKLREIIDVADRFVVLLDGETALDRAASTTSLEELVAVMSARRAAVLDDAAAVRRSRGDARVLCTLRDARTPLVGPINLEVRAGEVLGITGLVGSGLHDIAYLVGGRMRPSAGVVETAPGLRRGCVPAHRESEGVFPDDTEEFNLTAGNWTRWRRAGGLLDVRRLRADADAVANELSVLPANLDAVVSSLSGGNQQKVVLGRALIDDPELLVLCEPTRGVDVATRRDIYRHVRRIAGDGTAVVVASSDLEDLVALADHATILRSDGTLAPWVDADHIPDLALELVAL